MSIINLEDFLLNELGPGAAGTDALSTAQGPPTTQPDGLMGNMPQQGGEDPNITNQQTEMPDAASDPKLPDMPEEKEEVDFEAWKKKFLVESITGDVQKLKAMILDVRDRDLDWPQRKFVEDNLQIIFGREWSNIEKASKEIRKLIKEELDHNNPATSVVNHMIKVLAEQPLLNNCFIKLTGMLGSKGDIHRKFIAALTGSIQVGSGAYNEDLIYNEKDYSIRMSTRFNSRFGDVHLGQWALKSDDPERYLKKPELARLEDGSPEEKDVLRRRVVMESIAEAFKTRAFIINVVGVDGTIYTLGWDLSTSLKAAYTEGRLVVRSKQDDSAEAMIDDDGAIIPFVDLKIMYVKKTGEQDEDGTPLTKETDFITTKYGQLYLSAPLPIIKEAGSVMQGYNFKETPWTGNPSDLRTLSRCVVSFTEQIMKQC